MGWDENNSNPIDDIKAAKRIIAESTGASTTNPVYDEYLKNIGKRLNMEHTWYECKCNEPGCQFCDGGLGWCRVCDGFEGTLSTDCVGHKLREQTQNAIWKGYIDFKDGHWGPGVRWQKGRLISWKEYSDQLKAKRENEDGDHY